MVILFWTLLRNFDLIRQIFLAAGGPESIDEDSDDDTVIIGNSGRQSAFGAVTADLPRRYSADAEDWRSGRSATDLTYRPRHSSLDLPGGMMTYIVFSRREIDCWWCSRSIVNPAFQSSLFCCQALWKQSSLEMALLLMSCVTGRRQHVNGRAVRQCDSLDEDDGRCCCHC